MSSEPSTPLMRQYTSIKQKYPEALLLFRLGDFYEMFFEDAVVAARELQITLTSRNKEKGIAVPMCGVPHHSAENYISRLLQKGYKVAVCEQMEDPRLAKKLVRREVTRVITPGTAAGLGTLPAKENNFLASVARSRDRIGAAFADLSTGEFLATEFCGDDREHRFREEIDHFRVRELVFASGQQPFPDASQRFEFAGAAAVSALTLTPLDAWPFDYDHAAALLAGHLRVRSLDGFGFDGHPQAVAAAGALLHYLKETQQGSLSHLDRIRFYERQQWMVLDGITVRNLELFDPLFAGETAATLFATMDRTATSMGARLLRSWLLRPLLDTGVINARLDAVEELVTDPIRLGTLQRELAAVHDLERLLSKVVLGTAMPRDLAALRSSVKPLPHLRALMAEGISSRWRELAAQTDDLADLHQLLSKALADSPPLNPSDGGIIRDGYDAELDELRNLSVTGKQTIAGMEAREREATGIQSLKIKFNNVFGYYIEVSRSNLPLVPARYERKQTLVGAERFTTPELKEYERKVLDAEERMQQIEQRLFLELRAAIGEQAARIRSTAAAVAEADVLGSFASLAAEAGYCRPVFSTDGVMEVAAGRHPVLERLGEAAGAERFVPNDIFLHPDFERIVLITGPNMGGKSTYLRQAALIAIMAQAGSFVPAQSARLPVFDRIFTRIGASDNLARGRSTFMVEMTETAVILNTATANSLVVLDEIGRGTATFDGLAIAWSVVEYLHARPGVKVLFATHYHELTELAEQLPGVTNRHVSVRESDGNIVFLRRVEPGGADRSYGIEVARLAGLPLEVVERAREVLAQHERSEHQWTGRLSPGALPPDSVQLTLFSPTNNAVIEKIARLSIEELKPIEALNLLAQFQREINGG